MKRFSAYLIAGLLLAVFAQDAWAQQPEKRNVAVVLHDFAELLDFTAPLEVFASSWFEDESGHAFNVFTVAETDAPVRAQPGSMKVLPDHTIVDSPKPDVLVIPGGWTSRLIKNQTMMQWIEQMARDAEVVLTVCSGVFVLQELGLLDGLGATTHWKLIHELKEDPDIAAHENVRFVDNGKYVTTAGISASLDGSLHVVAKLLGEEAAHRTARELEYTWSPERGLIVSPSQ